MLRVVERSRDSGGIVLDDVGSEIVDFSAFLGVSIITRDKSQRFLATAAVGVSFSFLKEGERTGNSSSSSSSAVTALNLRNTVGVFADKLAFGLGAVGFVAFPVALGFFADCLAFGLGSLAVGDTVGSLADSDALGAVE